MRFIFRKLNWGLLIALLLSFTGCEKSKKTEQQATKSETALPKSVAPEDNTLTEELTTAYRPFDSSKYTVITEKSVVFTLPDTSLIRDMIEDSGEESFYEGGDEMMYKQNKAAEWLKKKDIRVVYPTTRYLVFRTQKKDYIIDTQKKEEYPWESIFFEPAKAPSFFDPDNVKKEYRNYFN